MTTPLPCFPVVCDSADKACCAEVEAGTLPGETVSSAALVAVSLGVPLALIFARLCLMKCEPPHLFLTYCSSRIELTSPGACGRHRKTRT